MPEINFIFVPLPAKCHGAVVPNPDGSYTIVLDPNDSYEKQRETAAHEISHIEDESFSMYDATIIEEIAHYLN